MQDTEGLYGDGGESSTPPKSSEREDSGAKTAVIPAELCPGMQVGDEIRLRIVSSDEDSYEVSYEPEGEAPNRNTGSVSPEPDEMSSMME